MGDQTANTYEVRVAEIAQAWRERGQRGPAREHQRVLSPTSYRSKLGRETIHLDTVAFRILTFLAATPYRAHTRRRIAHAVTSHRFPVAEETLDQHVRSLREQLGFFRDYIQSVPFIGYRFKA